MIGLDATEWAEVLRWLLWQFAAGILVLPALDRLAPGLGAAGPSVAKILAHVALPFVPWVLSVFGLASFASAGPAIGVLTLALLFTLTREPLPWRRIAVTEALFLLLFLLGLAARLAEPNLNTLEKFTDLGLVQAALRSDHMPPEDLWFAGAAVNYYYVGHAFTALWTRLADVPADHGYQLMMASLFALTGLGVGAVCLLCLRHVPRRLAGLLATIGAALALYAGNLHSFLYDVLRDWMPTAKDSFYYPDSTRFIGFDPDVPDKGFTEFTAYGFRVGDLHAHVIATPVFLLTLVVLFSLARTLPERIEARQVLFFGWLLGLLGVVNSWDFAIAGLIGAMIFAFLVARPGARDRLVAMALGALAVAFATAAPFLAGFDSFGQGVRLVAASSPLWQLGVIYGHALPAIVALLVLLFVIRKPPVGLLFAGILALAAVLLIVIPEALYLKDIYGADYARTNTMFKLSFRAQTLLQIASLVAVGTLAARGTVAAVVGYLVAVPLLLTFAYASWTVRPPSAIGSLDGLAFLGDERSLAEALADLPLAPGEAILEAPGESFTSGSRMSTVAGKPTLIGWRGHELLWRGHMADVDARVALVDRIYREGFTPGTCRLLALFDVRYIVVARAERDRYGAEVADRLATGTVPAAESDAGAILRVLPGPCPG
ncbi:DUF2298 domain-containing protein [Pelagovum pacificum]|uniref:YYY membrane protein n=1 Tax=Pelagovum pacificum TaxID=2588711 RepID=A0A5C5GHA3_9RHOB|nr:DUF2298 domain-containing protein [Pelagovum pacificum]QQA43594.1 hypothetical protein I8N54_03180 [Pelagovum pacificum]TNY33271.1 hypothetical protein FHY64_08350 [Pelagovum pacificum]